MTSSNDIDTAASAFATAHGSFALLFDASENYGGREPCPLPWTLMLDTDQSRGWAGHTAIQAIEEAGHHHGGSEVNDPKRREQRRTHLDASAVPVERALLARADALEAEAQRLGPKVVSASTYILMAAEHRALAEELHFW